MIKRKPLLLNAPATTTYQGGWAMPQPHSQLQQAKSLRDKIGSRYDEAISFSMPGRDGINSGPDDSVNYDDTAVQAVPEFASRIQQGVIPNFSQWASYVAGILITDEDEKAELKDGLEQVDKYLFEMLNSSNFSVDANECFLDLALGTMALRIDEGAFDNPFACRSIPLRSLAFCNGPDGRPDPIYETRKIALNHLKVHYPNAVIPPEVFAGRDAGAELEVVEAWHRDWSVPGTIKYRQSVFIAECDNRTILTEWHTGPGACPYIVARWSKASGEGWGRGPAFNCLPSMRKVNFAERSLLDHSDIAIAGIWTMEDDGVVNTSTVRLEPGTLVPVAAGSAGLKNVAPGANFDISQFLLEEARNNIKRALYTEQLGNPNKTPMSAAEVNQRMAELARSIGSSFGRLIVEFTMPVIVRATRILEGKGLIKMPRVDGKKIKLIPTSPLAQAQRFENADNLTHFGQTLAGVLGAQFVNVVLDGTKWAAELADNMQIPQRVMRPPAQQRQIIAALTQQATAAQGSPNGADPGAGGGGAPA